MAPADTTAQAGRPNARPKQTPRADLPFELPSWTQADEHDELDQVDPETEMKVRRRRARALGKASKNQPRQDIPWPTAIGPSVPSTTSSFDYVLTALPPSPEPEAAEQSSESDSGEESGVDSGLEKGEVSSDESGDEAAAPAVTPPAAGSPGGGALTTMTASNTVATLTAGSSPSYASPTDPPTQDNTEIFPGDEDEIEDEEEELEEEDEFEEEEEEIEEEEEFDEEDFEDEDGPPDGPPVGPPGGSPSPTSTSLAPSSSPTSTPGIGDFSNEDASGREAQMRHHRSVETALTVVGSVVGAAIVGLCIWYFLRRYKKRKAQKQNPYGFDGSSYYFNGYQQQGQPSSYQSGIKPSRRARIFAKVPFLKNRAADSTWYGIDEPYVVNEKAASIPSSNSEAFFPTHPTGAATSWSTERRALPLDTSSQMTNPNLYPSPSSQYSTLQPGQWQMLQPPNRQMPPTQQQQTVSPISQDGGTVVDLNRPLPHEPIESPLSSAFGNGTYVLPTPRFRQDGIPDDESRRLSTFTQSTVSNGQPRFRTISAWVRQQTNRTQRSSQAPEIPPEPNFNLMMPDGEEPRRVDVNQPNGPSNAN